MKTCITTTWAMLALFLFISYGCNQKKSSPATTPDPTPTTITPPKQEPQTEQPVPKSEPEEPTTPTPSDNIATLPQSAKCDSPNFDLVKNIQESAELLKGTPYSQANKTDCSGIFHKVLNELKKACPNSILPTINNARSTRDLAKWYHDHGDFKIIRNPKEESQLIQEGTVMFYGYGTRTWPYDHKTITIDTLTVRNVGINHVAIVTSVERENGIVKSYRIFHGRNPRNPAGITTSSRVYQRRPNLPTYGNWKEPWLAVANVLGKK